MAEFVETTILDNEDIEWMESYRNTVFIGQISDFDESDIPIHRNVKLIIRGTNNDSNKLGCPGFDISEFGEKPIRSIEIYPGEDSWNFRITREDGEIDVFSKKGQKNG